MALKRLDEEFELKPGTQLLPYMKRLLPSLEARFQDLEGVDRELQAIADEIRAAALLRMNEILIPATEDIIAITKLGFLLAPVTEVLYTIQLGYMAVYVDDGPQAKTFTPSPYIIIEGIDDPNNYSLAKTIGYDAEQRIFEMEVTAIHGDPRPQPWMLTSTPGMAQSTKDYHDVIAPMHTEVRSDTIEVRGLHADIMAALQALEESGLDLYNYVRYDGTTPFRAVQGGIAPDSCANDTSLVTAAWSRALMVEYINQAVLKSGSTMTGPLYLSGYPTQPNQAATKEYVDSSFGVGGTMMGNLTIKTNYPSIMLYPNGIGQDRIVYGLGSNGTNRWGISLGNADQESGSLSGSNFALYKYGDAGEYGGAVLSISRANGHATFGGAVSTTGNMNVNGDLYATRGDGTGVIFFGTGYHYWNGSTHHFTGGGGSFDGPVSTHALNTHAISTQGHYLTSWGLTSHGQADINGPLVVRGDVVIEGGGANYLRFWDNTYGNSYIHHNDGTIGFLGHDGGWRMYTNAGGYIWCAALGWVHDWVNGQANWYAWNAADTRYNQLVATIRFHHLGDVQHYFNGLQEPWGGAVITGMTGAWASYYVTGRYRQLHMLIGGGWHAAGY